MEALLDCLEWDAGLQVGVKQIDEQHKRLFCLLKEISAISIYSKQIDKINPVINELIDHVIRCFSEEEQAMKGHGYPGLAIQEQQQQHLGFVKMLILELDLRHLNKMPTIELLERLANLLRDHIVNVDKKYADFLSTVRLGNCIMNFGSKPLPCTLPQPLPSKGGGLKIPSPLVGEG